MKKQINKLGLASLLAIGISAPCLYAQCVTESTCAAGGSWTDPLGQFYCSGSSAQSGGGEEQVWLEGDDACGTGHLISTGADVGGSCGMTEIVTECA